VERRGSLGGLLAGGRGQDGHDVQLDLHLPSDQPAAGLQGHVPGEPELLAVELAPAGERGAGLTLHPGHGALVVDVQHDHPLGYTHLRRREPDAWRSIHCFHQVINQLCGLPGDIF